MFSVNLYVLLVLMEKKGTNPIHGTRKIAFKRKRDENSLLLRRGTMLNLVRRFSHGFTLAFHAPSLPLTPFSLFLHSFLCPPFPAL